ncbi:hypothetical protein BO79DRAFT_233382 [Aspergillus costaricaensis CBS 115574]|uniref:Uncharacterized protein n=1 Tax=Aspergillus costaricaensis CBS 115574 TaxID=1448317 RepID=A0ACD1HZL5_9EURO|nr:hypothetical protein BO79DRAFT_233382 [Aspergillus costaricaensis CBS 115574]RAK83413.1 hypothetical protein BO79DRAFT_233382 [Aspergillus costaricaensis CBS 115574]
MSAREFQELGRPEAGGRAFEKRYGDGMNELASRAAFAWLLARRIPMVRVLRYVPDRADKCTQKHGWVSRLAVAWGGTILGKPTRLAYQQPTEVPSHSTVDNNPRGTTLSGPGSCHGASYDGDRLRKHKGGVDDEPITGAKIVNGHGSAPIMSLPVACSLQGPMARHHYLTFIVLPALIRRLLQMHGHESCPGHSFNTENHAETTGTDVVAAGMLFRLVMGGDAYPDVGPLPTLAPNFRDPGVSCARSMALHTDRCMLMRNLRAKARQPAILSSLPPRTLIMVRLLFPSDCIQQTTQVEGTRTAVLLWFIN